MTGSDRAVNGHNRIAVLGAEVNEAYQAELWKGISEEAEKHSKQLICFMGSRNDPVFPVEKGFNPSYRLAHSGNFDGVIIVSSTVSSYLEPAHVRSLFDVRPHIPKISIGLEFKGAGSVCVDGRDAMRTITEHLVTEHKRKNFALIAGPAYHPESEQRRKTVIGVLESSGLPIDPVLQIHGTFEQSSGRESMRVLLRANKPIDAVICLNDQMALGAIEALSELNISVPDMVSVCGFDGIEESAYCSPPLTTVRQPLYQMGVTAVKELYRLMNGGLPRNITLTCLPVIRQSCACGMEINRVYEPESIKVTKHKIIDEDRLDQLLNKNCPEKFLEEIKRIVNSSIYRPDDYFLLDEKLSGLNYDLMEPYGEWYEVIGNAKQLLWKTRTRHLIDQRIRKKHRSDLLRSVGASLTGAFEMPELFTHLADGLLRLGFRHGFLVLYTESEDPGKPFVRLVFRLKDRKFFKDVSIPFSNSEVLPNISVDLDTDDCMSWMFTPLIFQKSAIGHMLLPGTHPDTEIYDTLARQIASSLQGAILLEQVRSHEKSLLKVVERRTEELTRVNSELRQEIVTRSRLEQEVIDISKYTMERIGQDLHDDLCQYLAGISMHVSVLRSLIGKSDSDAVQAADQINSLLSDSITRTKRIVRGLLPLGINEAGISDALEGLCSEMSRLSGMKINYQRDERINMLQNDRAIEIYRIIQEAINNSIKHSGGSEIKVEIETELSNDELAFSIIIRDNGKGISGESRGGMGLKIMRYRGERAGVSLDIESSSNGVIVYCKGGKKLSDE